MGQQSEVTLWLKIKQQGAEAITAVKESISEMGDSLFEFKNLAMEAAAVMLEQFGEKLVKAFAESEQGIIRLNAALRVSGRYSDEGTDKIQAMAEQMSRLTDVSKDAAIGISATLAQYTHTLSADQLANLQKAAVALHAMTGQDIASAATGIARAIEGQGRALKRLGIEISATGTEQQNYNKIMDQLGPKFAVAEAMNNSLMGQFAQFGHATEELRKSLGHVIAESINMAQTGPGLTKTIFSWSDAINNNIGTWVKWGSVVVAVVKSLWQFIVFLATELWNFGKISYYSLKGVVETLWDLVLAFKDGAVVIKNAFVLTWEEIKAGAGTMYNFAVGILNQLIEKFNTVSPVKIPLFDQVTVDMAGVNTAAQGVIASVAKLKGDFTDMGTVWHNTWGDISHTYDNMNENAKRLFGSYQSIINLWNAPVKPNAAFSVSHEGGGANSAAKGDDPVKEMKRLEQQLRSNKQAWDSNADSTATYVDKIKALAPQIQSVMDSLADSPESLVAFQGVVASLNKELNKLGYNYKDGAVTMLSVSDALNLKFREAIKTAGTLNLVIANMAENTFKGFFTAIQTAFQAMVDGSKSAAKAFGDAMLGTLAQVAQGFGEFFLGRAAGAIAEALLPSNVFTGASAGGLAAAGEFTAAAAAMFALSGILGGLSKSGTTSSGGGSSASSAAQQTSAVNSNQQPGTIVIEGGLLDMSDPRQADALASAINTLKNRRIIIQAG